MKKLFYLTIVIAITIFASCDYVSNPIPESNLNGGDTASCPSPTFTALTTHVKKILIEDFTGHVCGNCPTAAAKLHQLDTTYPGRVVGLAIHPLNGGLADPTPGFNGSPSTAYVADFRTIPGNEYDDIFGAGTYGLPEGMFNRKDFNATTFAHLKDVPSWSSYMAGIIAEPSVVDLQLMSSFDATTKKLCTAVHYSFLTNLTGNYSLVVLLTQDSIVDWQYDGATNLSNYTFNHMLRDVITPAGAWGDTIVTGGTTAGLNGTLRFAYNIPAQYKSIPCDPAQCHVVAFIYNTTTYEVIQSEEEKVIP